MFKLSRLLTLILALLVLLAGVYLLRWPLFGNLAREATAEALYRTFYMSLQVGEVSGSPFGTIRVRSIRGYAEDERAVARDLHLENVELRFNFLKLWKGDLSGLDVHANSASLLLELDRPGVPAPEGEEFDLAEISPPGTLPVLKIDSGRLILRSAGRTFTLEGFSLNLEEPGGEGFQAGELATRRIAFASSQGETSGIQVQCPLQYREGWIRLGPLAIGERKRLMHLEASFKPGAPPAVEWMLESSSYIGKSRYRGSLYLEESLPFDVDFELDRVDLAYLPEWISELTDMEWPLRGILRGRGTLKGDFDHLSATDILADVEVTRGGFGAIRPLDVSTDVSFQGDTLQWDACEIRSGSSRIRLEEGRLPFQDGKPDLDGAGAEFDLKIRECGAWLEKAGLEEEYTAFFAQARAEGRGRYEERMVRLDRLHVSRESDEISLADASLSFREPGMRLQMAGLDGRMRNQEFKLLEPLQVEWDTDRVKVATLHLRTMKSEVFLHGEVDWELGAGSVQARLVGVDPSQIRDWVPPEVFFPPLKWEGFELNLEAEGTLSAPDAKLRASADLFTYDSVRLEDVRIEADLSPERVAIDHLALRLPKGGEVSGSAAWNVEGDAFWNPPGSMNASAEVRKLNPAALGMLWPSFEKSEGSLDLRLDMAGSLANPSVTAALHGVLRQPPDEVRAFLEDRAQGLSPLDVRLEIEQEGHRVQVNQLTLESDLGSLSAKGLVPVALRFDGKDGWLRLQDDASIEADLSLSCIDLARVDPAWNVEGMLSADLSVAGPLRYPAGRFSARVDGLYAGYLEHQDFDLEGGLHEGFLSIDRLALTGDQSPNLSGTISLDLNDPSGSGLALPNPDTRIMVDLATEEGSLDSYLAQLDLPGEGEGTLSLRGGGLLGDPSYELELFLARWVFPEIETSGPFRIIGSAVIGGESTRITKARLEHSYGWLEGSARLPLGMGLDRLREGALLDEEGSMEGEFKSSDIDIALLHEFIPNIRRLTGTLSGRVLLRGTLTDPKYEADLELTRGSLRFETAVPSIEELEGSLKVDGRGLFVNRLDGTAGAGPVRLTGWIPWTDGEQDALDLRLKGEHALLYRGRGLRVRGDLDVAITGPLSSPLISGKVRPVDTRYVRRLGLSLAGGPPSVEGRVQPFSLTDPVLKDLRFDLAFRTEAEGDVFVDNNFARGDLQLDLSLKGTGDVPYYVGDATFNDMILKLPFFRFKVESGRFYYLESNPFMPNVHILAHGRRRSYDVDLVVQGPLDDLEIIGTSNPPLDNMAVIVLISTGKLPESIEEKGVGNEAVVQAGYYLGEELFHELFGSETTESQESLAERFALYVGTEVGNNGTDNILLEFNAKGPWYLQMERDIYRDYNMGVVYRIRFR